MHKSRRQAQARRRRRRLRNARSASESGVLYRILKFACSSVIILRGGFVFFYGCGERLLEVYREMPRGINDRYQRW